MNEQQSFVSVFFLSLLFRLELCYMRMKSKGAKKNGFF